MDNIERRRRQAARLQKQLRTQLEEAYRAAGHTRRQSVARGVRYTDADARVFVLGYLCGGGAVTDEDVERWLAEGNGCDAFTTLGRPCALARKHSSEHKALGGLGSDETWLESLEVFLNKTKETKGGSR